VKGGEMGHFTVHGSLDLHVQDRILLIEGCGPWNIEAVKDAYGRFEPFINTLYGSPWAVLIILHGDPIYVPDAASYIVETIKNERRNGSVASAILVGESNSPEFAKRHLGEIHTNAGDTFRFFSDKKEATWWLEQKLSAARIQ
jgi:predicted nicotinamide N-methyase